MQQGSLPSSGCVSAYPPNAARPGLMAPTAGPGAAAMAPAGLPLHALSGTSMALQERLQSHYAASTSSTRPDVSAVQTGLQQGAPAVPAVSFVGQHTAAPQWAPAPVHPPFPPPPLPPAAAPEPSHPQPPLQLVSPHQHLQHQQPVHVWQPHSELLRTLPQGVPAPIIQLPPPAARQLPEDSINRFCQRLQQNKVALAVAEHDHRCTERDLQQAIAVLRRAEQLPKLQGAVWSYLDENDVICGPYSLLQLAVILKGSPQTQVESSETGESLPFVDAMAATPLRSCVLERNTLRERLAAAEARIWQLLAEGRALCLEIQAAEFSALADRLAAAHWLPVGPHGAVVSGYGLNPAAVRSQLIEGALSPAASLLPATLAGLPVAAAVARGDLVPATEVVAAWESAAHEAQERRAAAADCLAGLEASMAALPQRYRPPGADEKVWTYLSGGRPAGPVSFQELTAWMGMGLVDSHTLLAVERPLEASTQAAEGNGASTPRWLLAAEVAWLFGGKPSGPEPQAGAAPPPSSPDLLFGLGGGAVEQRPPPQPPPLPPPPVIPLPPLPPSQLPPLQAPAAAALTAMTGTSGHMSAAALPHHLPPQPGLMTGIPGLQAPVPMGLQTVSSSGVGGMAPMTATGLAWLGDGGGGPMAGSNGIRGRNGSQDGTGLVRRGSNSGWMGPSGPFKPGRLGSTAGPSMTGPGQNDDGALPRQLSLPRSPVYGGQNPKQPLRQRQRYRRSASPSALPLQVAQQQQLPLPPPPPPPPQHQHQQLQQSALTGGLHSHQRGTGPIPPEQQQAQPPPPPPAPTTLVIRMDSRSQSPPLPPPPPPPAPAAAPHPPVPTAQQPGPAYSAQYLQQAPAAADGHASKTVRCASPPSAQFERPASSVSRAASPHAAGVGCAPRAVSSRSRDSSPSTFQVAVPASVPAMAPCRATPPPGQHLRSASPAQAPSEALPALPAEVNQQVVQQALRMTKLQFLQYMRPHLHKLLAAMVQDAYCDHRLRLLEEQAAGPVEEAQRAAPQPATQGQSLLADQADSQLPSQSLQQPPSQTHSQQNSHPEPQVQPRPQPEPRPQAQPEPQSGQAEESGAQCQRQRDQTGQREGPRSRSEGIRGPPPVPKTEPHAAAPLPVSSSCDGAAAGESAAEQQQLGSAATPGSERGAARGVAQDAEENGEEGGSAVADKLAGNARADPTAETSGSAAAEPGGPAATAVLPRGANPVALLQPATCGGGLSLPGTSSPFAAVKLEPDTAEGRAPQSLHPGQPSAGHRAEDCKAGEECGGAHGWADIDYRPAASAQMPAGGLRAAASPPELQTAGETPAGPTADRNSAASQDVKREQGAQGGEAADGLPSPFCADGFRVSGLKVTARRCRSGSAGGSGKRRSRSASGTEADSPGSARLGEASGPAVGALPGEAPCDTAVTVVEVAEALCREAVQPTCALHDAAVREALQTPDSASGPGDQVAGALVEASGAEAAADTATTLLPNAATPAATHPAALATASKAADTGAATEVMHAGAAPAINAGFPVASDASKSTALALQEATVKAEVAAGLGPTAAAPCLGEGAEVPSAAPSAVSPQVAPAANTGSAAAVPTQVEDRKVTLSIAHDLLDEILMLAWFTVEAQSEAPVLRSTRSSRRQVATTPATSPRASKASQATAAAPASAAGGGGGTAGGSGLQQPGRSRKASQLAAAAGQAEQAAAGQHQPPAKRQRHSAAAAAATTGKPAERQARHAPVKPTEREVAEAPSAPSGRGPSGRKATRGRERRSTRLASLGGTDDEDEAAFDEAPRRDERQRKWTSGAAVISPGAEEGATEVTAAQESPEAHKRGAAFGRLPSPQAKRPTKRFRRESQSAASTVECDGSPSRARTAGEEAEAVDAEPQSPRRRRSTEAAAVSEPDIGGGGGGSSDARDAAGEADVDASSVGAAAAAAPAAASPGPAGATEGEGATGDPQVRTEVSPRPPRAPRNRGISAKELRALAMDSHTPTIDETDDPAGLLLRGSDASGRDRLLPSHGRRTRAAAATAAVAALAAEALASMCEGSGGGGAAEAGSKAAQGQRVGGTPTAVHAAVVGRSAVASALDLQQQLSPTHGSSEATGTATGAAANTALGGGGDEDAMDSISPFRGAADVAGGGSGVASRRGPAAAACLRSPCSLDKLAAEAEIVSWQAAAAAGRGPSRHRSDSGRRPPSRTSSCTQEHLEGWHSAIFPGEPYGKAMRHDSLTMLLEASLMTFGAEAGLAGSVGAAGGAAAAGAGLADVTADDGAGDKEAAGAEAGMEPGSGAPAADSGGNEEFDGGAPVVPKHARGRRSVRVGAVRRGSSALLTAVFQEMEAEASEPQPQPQPAVQPLSGLQQYPFLPPTQYAYPCASLSSYPYLPELQLQPAMVQHEGQQHEQQHALLLLQQQALLQPAPLQAWPGARRRRQGPGSGGMEAELLSELGTVVVGGRGGRRSGGVAAGLLSTGLLGNYSNTAASATAAAGSAGRLRRRGGAVSPPLPPADAVPGLVPAVVGGGRGRRNYASSSRPSPLPSWAEGNGLACTSGGGPAAGARARAPTPISGCETTGTAELAQQRQQTQQQQRKEALALLAGLAGCSRGLPVEAMLALTRSHPGLVGSPKTAGSVERRSGPSAATAAAAGPAAGSAPPAPHPHPRARAAASEHRFLTAAAAGGASAGNGGATGVGVSSAEQREVMEVAKWRLLAARAKKLKFGRSRIAGWGLFAVEPIEPSEFVIEYCGELIRKPLDDVRQRQYDAAGYADYMFTVDDTRVVDATLTGNAARFINHCCDPNCVARVVEVGGERRIAIYSLRRIEAGEELHYDYKLSCVPGAERIPCGCGARNCKGFMN